MYNEFYGKFLAVITARILSFSFSIVRLLSLEQNNCARMARGVSAWSRIHGAVLQDDDDVVVEDW